MCHFVRKFHLSRDGGRDIVTDKRVVDFPRTGLVELVQSLVFLMMMRLDVAMAMVHEDIFGSWVVHHGHRPFLLLVVNYQALVAGIKCVRKSPHCRPPSPQLKRWCICDCCVNCICKCFQTYFSPNLNFLFVNKILCLGWMA